MICFHEEVVYFSGLGPFDVFKRLEVGHHTSQHRGWQEPVLDLLEIFYGILHQNVFVFGVFRGLRHRESLGLLSLRTFFVCVADREGERVDLEVLLVGRYFLVYVQNTEFYELYQIFENEDWPEGLISTGCCRWALLSYLF